MKDLRNFCFFVYLINIALRLPAVFQELPPFTFCDEDIYTLGGYRMYAESSWIPFVYLAGGFNFYPMILLSSILETVSESDLISPELYIVSSRLFGPIAIASLMPIFVTLTVAKFDSRRTTIVMAGFVSTLSPLALGLSRIFYPDQYIIGPIAAVIYLSVLAAKGEAKVIHFIISGILIGIASSIKYTGLLVSVLFAASFLVRNITVNPFRLEKQSRLFITASVALITFAAFNFHGILHFENILEAFRIHHTHYSGGHPGLEAVNGGYLFYLETLLLLSFGIFGIVLFTLGLLEGLRGNRLLTLLLISFCLLFLAVVGSYKVVINRNITPLLPIALIFISMGAASLIRIFSTFSRWRPLLISLALALIFVEPAWRNIMSLKNDFQEDGRRIASEWIADNLPAGDSIGFSKACWGVPFDVTRNPLIQFNMPAEPEPCVQYYVMDDWFYETWGPGNNPLLWAVIGEHHFINPGQKNVVLIPGEKPTYVRDKQDAFLHLYQPIKKFSERDFYGPTVTIFKRKALCEDVGLKVDG